MLLTMVACITHTSEKGGREASSHSINGNPVSRLLKFHSCGEIRRWEWAQNAHLLLADCAFSPISAFSRTRLSEFQEPVSKESERMGKGDALVRSCN